MTETTFADLRRALAIDDRGGSLCPPEAQAFWIDTHNGSQVVAHIRSGVVTVASVQAAKRLLGDGQYVIVTDPYVPIQIRPDSELRDVILAAHLVLAPLYTYLIDQERVHTDRTATEVATDTGAATLAAKMLRPETLASRLGVELRTGQPHQRT